MREVNWMYFGYDSLKFQGVMLYTVIIVWLVWDIRSSPIICIAIQWNVYFELKKAASDILTSILRCIELHIYVLKSGLHLVYTYCTYIHSCTIGKHKSALDRQSYFTFSSVFICIIYIYIIIIYMYNNIYNI